MYQFDNQILRLQSGRSIFTGVSSTLNESDSAGTNATTRLLQTETECNNFWAGYVTSAIEGEINSIIPSFETLDVKVGNITRSFLAEEDEMIIFFDVTVEIRSPLREHFLNRYVAGPFDSRSEQDDFILYLQSTGCPEFASVTGVRFVLPQQFSGSQSDDDSSSARTGLIVGLVIALAAAAILVGVFVFARLSSRDPSHLALEEQALDDLNTSHDREMVSEVGVRTNQDVSTLGDPIPLSSREQVVDASTEDSFSLDYDFQKADVQTQSILSGESNVDVPEDISQVLTDDDTVNGQYLLEERIEIEAPPGVLGLVLEANEDGVPVVHAIKQSSPLVGSVRIGDRLLSVDGNDVRIMLASDVSKLIASKKDQMSRRFIFIRSGTQLPAHLG